MDCGRYLELLSARLDGELSEAEERELEAHLKSCPACRAEGARLAALRTAFTELEEIPAPEDFTRDVMDCIRGLGPSKPVPLFRRPLFKALAGLAACAALAVGLYGAVSATRQDAHLMTRGISQEALEEAGDLSGFAEFSTTAVPDMDAPAEEREQCLTEMVKSVPDEAVVCDRAAAPVSDTEILVVERMPEGGWELVLPDACGSVDGLYVTGECLKQVERLAREQGITISITSGTEEAFLHLIVVLDETE